MALPPERRPRRRRFSHAGDTGPTAADVLDHCLSQQALYEGVGLNAIGTRGTSLVSRLRPRGANDPRPACRTTTASRREA